MKQSQFALKRILIAFVVFFEVSIAAAKILAVGPGRQYATPCPAIHAAHPGDTITIDYNNGVPYHEPPGPPWIGSRSDCVWFTNNLTIVGINGRPILDASGEYIQKAIFDVRGADTVIANLEFRHAATPAGQGNNAAGILIEGGTNAPAGGNVTIQFCYIHNNEDGLLTSDVGPGSSEGDGYPDEYYLSPNPYITLLHDEFAYNGIDKSGSTHNIYIGFDNTHKLTVSMEYSWSHDAYAGHVLKTRAPYSNVFYNMIDDVQGTSSFLLDFPNGGSDYIVGNVLYKAAATGYNASQRWMWWRDIYDNGPYYPVYGPPIEDLHFVNNTVVLDSSTEGPAFVVLSCNRSDASTCPPPRNGPALSVNAVVENNIFVGPFIKAVNQSTAVASNNLIKANTPANLAALFVDPAHRNYHLVAGASAISAGLYPPTDNTGAPDPKALPTSEYVSPVSGALRAIPTGSVMDEGAYSYSRRSRRPNRVETRHSSP